jgi:putative transcriptional regulator
MQDLKLPKAGSFLISDPFLKDPNFSRTVILLCDHNTQEGSFGFVMNKPQETTLSDLMQDLEDFPIPVYYGGPVQRETLHFIHRQPELIPGGHEIIKGIYWGGDYDVLVQNMKRDRIDFSKIRFFQGYSGWGAGQLAEELEHKSWIIHDDAYDLIFYHNPENLWKEVLKRMGGEYEQMINYPMDPKLN